VKLAQRYTHAVARPTGEVTVRLDPGALICRAEHPAVRKGKTGFRGRPHGVAFRVHLPDGYRVRFTGQVCDSLDQAPLGYLRLQCEHTDCRRISVYEILPPR
jgi:hypothetical protein